MKRTPTKHGMPELNKVSEKFLLAQAESGLAGMVEPTEEERKNVQEWGEKVWDMLGDTVQKFPYPIVGLYMYDHTKCTKMFAGLEGVCSNQQHTETGERRAIIGLDVDPVRRGGQYLAFLLLHEIAHAATAAIGHDDHFHQYLDYLIYSFNSEYGTSLVNDYCGD